MKLPVRRGKEIFSKREVKNLSDQKFLRAVIFVAKFTERRVRKLRNIEEKRWKRNRKKEEDGREINLDFLVSGSRIRSSWRDCYVISQETDKTGAIIYTITPRDSVFCLS